MTTIKEGSHRDAAELDVKGNPTAKDIHEALAAHYDGKNVVKVHPFGWDDPMIAAGTMAGKDSMEIVVNGHEDQTIITALFDNLGKGASVQLSRT